MSTKSDPVLGYKERQKDNQRKEEAWSTHLSDLQKELNEKFKLVEFYMSSKNIESVRLE